MIAAKTLLTLSVALLALAFVSIAPGAPPERDDALDDLLRKVEEKESAPAAKPSAEADRGDSKADGASSKSKPKPSGELAPRDKDLDGLLEKLGASDDKPSPDERKPPAGGPSGDPEKGQDKDKKADALKGKDRDLDEHLEEAAGKHRKKKPQGSESDGPLGQVIKEMREVEERLGKPDTGEETRKKEEEIVKKLETLIEQARNSPQRTMVRKKMQGKAQGKQQPGQNPGEQAGTTGGNAPFTKPQKPTDRRSLAGGKELWGDLPPEVRQDLDNVMKEGFLPSREELIRRYYLSLSKKKPTRGE